MLVLAVCAHTLAARVAAANAIVHNMVGELSGLGLGMERR